MYWQPKRNISKYRLLPSGALIGFVIGLIIATYSNEAFLYHILIGFSTLGLIIGYIILKKIPYSSTVSRSADLDSFQDRFIDKTKDDILLDLLPSLSDSELITAYAYQYYDLLKPSRILLFDEIKSRIITRIMIRDFFERNVIDYHGSNGYCPRCGSMRYVQDLSPEKPNCLICDYNIIRDNPNAFHNRLKKLFGMYNDRMLTWSQMEEYLEL